MPRFLRFVLLCLILMFVAMVSALTAMRFAIHGRETTVPKLVGMAESQAEGLARSNGLLVEVEDRFYSQEVAEGRIVSQEPLPGTRVRRGWRMRVALSLGPQRIQIPNLIGQSARAAQMNADRRGLELSSIATAKLEGEPPEQIIAQSPTPATPEAVAPKISVLTTLPIGDRAYVMPTFIGKRLGEVTAALEESGARLGNVVDVTPNTSGAATGGKTAAQKAPQDPNLIVVKQIPAPGQRITPNDAIDLQVAKPQL